MKTGRSDSLRASTSTSRVQTISREQNPRYEVIRGDRTHIAHVNVERPDLQPDAGIATLPPLLGRGYLLPFPVLPRERFRTVVLPTPMATTQQNLPLRLLPSCRRRLS